MYKMYKLLEKAEIGYLAKLMKNKDRMSYMLTNTHAAIQPRTLLRKYMYRIDRLRVYSPVFGVFDDLFPPGLDLSDLVLETRGRRAVGDAGHPLLHTSYLIQLKLLVRRSTSIMIAQSANSKIVPLLCKFNTVQI